MSKFSFKITESSGVKNIIYQIDKEKKENENDIIYKITRVKSKTITNEDYIIKKFMMDDVNKELLLLSVWKDKYIINGGYVNDKELVVSSKPKGAKYTNIETNTDIEYFSYTPSEDRKIIIINLDTAEELKEKKIIDDGKEYIVCELKPNKKYLAIEFRFGSYRTVAVGICKFEKKNEKYYADIDPTEARRIDYDLFIDSINKDMSKKIPVSKEINYDIEK